MSDQARLIPAIALWLISAVAAMAEVSAMREVGAHSTPSQGTREAAATTAPRREPAPFPQFQARRIAPPKAGTARRITVQIDPDAAPPPSVAAPAPTLSTRAEEPIGKYTWFWDRISPEMDRTGPGRLPEALRTLSGTGKIAAPRLQALQQIAREQGAPILRATVGTRVSPALVLAMIAIESSGRPEAVSGAGAQGLMQLMPDTAARFGVRDSLSPEENIAGGVKYLDWLMGEFNNDPILVLAGYNAGEGSVHNHAGVPPYAETRDYVPKVLAAFQVASGLCATPPELISDGCVFVTRN